jgi:hypothetical protein
LKAKLYSPVFVDLSGYDDDGDFTDELSQRRAAMYQYEISEALRKEWPRDEAERGLMAYYGDGTIDEKVRSLTLDVEIHGEKLWTVASLDITEPLSRKELNALRDYVEGQYSDGFGEGFEQKPIKTEDGELNVHLWKHGQLFIDTQAQFAERLGIALPDDALSALAPDDEPLNLHSETPDHSAESPETVSYLRSMLIERARQNWDGYRHSPHPVTPDSIFHISVAVVAHRDAQVLLKEYGGFSAEQLKCLLQFADPVDLIADYLTPNPDASELAGIISSVMENQADLKAHYALADAPVPDPAGRGYLFSVSDGEYPYIPGILHVERDDSLFKYPDDAAAALAAERDGIKLIHGMPHVPDGVYLDTQENRAAIADHFERHRLSLPASEELAQAVRQRLDGNFADYKTGFENMTALETFSEAAEIAAVCQSYNYFRNEHDYKTGEAEFLLKFKDPLDLVSDRWSDISLFIGDTVNGIFSDQERTLQNGGYILVPDEPARTPPEASHKNAAEKPSVLDRIRRHQEKTRNNPASPKDARSRKNSEPEH